MAIFSHIDCFFGLDIEEYDPRKGIQNEHLALRIDEPDDYMMSALETLIADPKLAKIQALIIGAWLDADEDSAQFYMDFLVANADKFPNLKALFVGEIILENCELSWIQQGNYTAIWSAFPHLQLLQIRGSDGLSLGRIPQNQLTQLIIETAGLKASVLDEIAHADWPELQHLELWLGCSYCCYHWDGDIDAITPLLSPELLPKLTSLALKNSEIQPQILAALIESDILPQLTTIDMSMGILGDKDAELILQHKDKFSGKKLNLSKNYISDLMITKLQACLEVIAEKQRYHELGEGQRLDESYRYISVAE